ncbi:MAG: YggS family pyridoxal phosphate-dependent enzyme [Lachnospiraceae bacterium]
MISDNINEVKKNIEKACLVSGRSIDDVCLIAVSKTKPIEMLLDAYNANMRDFGENKVQEMCDKMPQMPDDVKWHMIGHLQTNKIKYIIGKTTLIHSVDSYHLAEAISRESVKNNCVTDILLEVNVANEETKFGLTVDETIPAVEKISKLSGICVKGLMTIAPFVDNPEQNREIFRKLKKLSIDITNKHIDNVIMNILSMGMTNDYMVAIEEGATHVRIGTGIFGERNYNKL